MINHLFIFPWNVQVSAPPSKSVLLSMWLLQVSDDAERSLLVKLKTECGYQFTSKLESMFTDIKTSRDMMLEYRNREQSSASADDMEINVQASGSCPFLGQRQTIV